MSSIEHQAELKLVQMHIGEAESSFSWNGGSEVITLPIGYDSIASRYFRHAPPTYDDIEYAINDIEDQIEKVARKIPIADHALVNDQGFVYSIARQAGLPDSDDMVLRREALEALFGRYAEIAAGRPPQADEPDTSRRFYAQLLIFREYMHHLKFDRIGVSAALQE